VKKIVCLDFDGVIHSYASGWCGARCIPDPPVPGMLQWIEDFIIKHCSCPDSICAMAPEGDFELCIYSSRSRYFGARRAMKRWMVKHGFDKRFFEVLRFPTQKPPAFLQIDDRVIRFNGTPPAFAEVVEFAPWTRTKRA
jgi:hypothetical protein